MPLTEPVAREELHSRTLEMRGYRREDGLFEIEGRITDIKSHDFHPPSGRQVPAATPLHEMRVRLTVDDRLVIREVQGTMDFTPYLECAAAAPNLQVLQGASLGKGWRKVIAERLGGTLGCTHVRELLNAMGSAAAQSITPVLRASRPEPAVTAAKPPPLVDTCYGFASGGAVAARRWPQLYPLKAAAKDKG